jgi:AcrR family transcriptional regulator
MMIEVNCMPEKESIAPRKRKKGIETTERILNASAALFASNGYDGVSLHAIAAAAGIRESSLYNHFRSKADILETLFGIFRDARAEFRPSQDELDRLLPLMQPEELFRHILFYFGRHEDPLIENIAMVITNEKYKNATAAAVYYASIVNEPSDYYETLIGKMIERGMVRRVDARAFAEQYNYVSIALTKEYFMAKNGLADLETVVRYMIQTIRFFCGLMQ